MPPVSRHPPRSTFTAFWLCNSTHSNPGSFTAGLTDGRNGISFFDPQNLGPITVTKNNNSAAAEDLGLLGGTYDAPSATFIAQ